MNEIKPAIIMIAFFIFFAGVVFPMIIWVGGQTFFPDQANGSLLTNKNGKVIGSSLIGQIFTEARYFHPRPSAAGIGYDASTSSGTNLGPISAKLHTGIGDDPSTLGVDESFAGIQSLARSYREENDLSSEIRLPSDSVTRSASGLDPHISPENAKFQARRIAKARAISTSVIESLILKNIEPRFLGIFGEPRLNVLKINLALDQTL